MPGDTRRWGDQAPTAGSSETGSSASQSRSRAERDRDRPPGAGPDLAPDPEGVARATALRLLTAAPRSRAELMVAMSRKGVPADVAEVVLDRFGEVGLVDDAAYAAMFVRSRHTDRGLAGAALRAELHRRGVDDDTAVAALEQLGPQTQEITARRLVDRKLASTAHLETSVRVRRTMAALGRKGYPPGLVARLVREALASHGVVADEDGDLSTPEP